jgi:antitoxin ParD1/3/4
MPTRNVNLTEHFDRFIETGIASVRFSNASEVVREGLRLLEQREREDRARIKWLRGAAKEGFDQLDRGEGLEFDSMDDLGAFPHLLAYSERRSQTHGSAFQTRGASEA